MAPRPPGSDSMTGSAWFEPRPRSGCAQRIRRRGRAKQAYGIRNRHDRVQAGTLATTSGEERGGRRRRCGSAVAPAKLASVQRNTAVARPPMLCTPGRRPNDPAAGPPSAARPRPQRVPPHRPGAIATAAARGPPTGAGSPGAGGSRPVLAAGWTSRRGGTRRAPRKTGISVSGGQDRNEFES
jgi:hypothetical protein